MQISRFPAGYTPPSPVVFIYQIPIRKPYFLFTPHFFDHPLSCRALLRCYIRESCVARISLVLAPTSTPRRRYHTALGGHTGCLDQAAGENRGREVGTKTHDLSFYFLPLIPVPLVRVVVAYSTRTMMRRVGGGWSGNIEAIRLYREIMKATRLFHWCNDKGEPW